MQKFQLPYVFCLLGLLLCSCSTINRSIITEEGRFAPKEPRYKLKGFFDGYKGEYLIDTDAVYIKANYGLYAGRVQLDSSYYFIRFFPEGQFYSSKHFEKMPTKNQIDAMNGGYIGYYKFTDNGTIIIETFTPKELNSYIMQKAKVIKEGVYVYLSKTRGWDTMWSKTNSIYYKKKLSDLGGAANW